MIAASNGIGLRASLGCAFVLSRMWLTSCYGPVSFRSATGSYPILRAVNRSN